MHIENPNDSTDKLLRLRSKSTKVLAIEVNIPKSITFICTMNKNKKVKL